MLSKITGFPAQITPSWVNGQSAPIDGMREPQHILITGMGGSAIAGDLLGDLLFNNLSIPVSVNRGYDLPAFVNEHTLLLASSYSGNTEETLSAVQEGLNRKAMVAVFTSNGSIAKIASEHALPAITFPPGYPPRSALGFSFFSMLGFLKQIIDIPVSKADIEDLEHLLTTCAQNLTQEGNEIEQLASVLIEHLPVLHISCRLASVAYRWQTQINENGKAFAHFHTIPEANHNEIVGLDNPSQLVAKMHLIFLRAPLFENKRIEKRFRISKQVLTGEVSGVTEVNAMGASRLSQMFSLILKGDFLSYYLSQLSNRDPTPVVRIEQLKKGLKET